MKKEDFKFVPMFAFEEGYLESQGRLPEEERDHPRRKFDFSGGYLESGADRPLRAENLAIVRELAFSFSFPLRGRIECARGAYAKGWDPYVRLPGSPSEFVRHTAGYGSHVHHAKPVGDLFMSDRSYAVRDHTVNVLDGARDDEFSFTRWYQCELPGFAKLGEQGAYRPVRPSRTEEMTDADRDAVTGPYAVSGAGAVPSLLDCYASPSRVDVECLLLGLGLSVPDPSYEPAPLSEWSVRQADHDPMSRGSFAFGEAMEDVYKRESHVKHADMKLDRDMYISVLKAAKSFRVVPEADAKAAWNLVKMSDGRHPKASAEPLDIIFEGLDGLTFVRTFDLFWNYDTELRSSDKWYLRSEDVVLARCLAGAKVARWTREEHQGKCKTTEDGNVRTTVCTYEEPTYTDKTEYDPETSLIGQVTWDSFLVWDKVTTTYNADTGETKYDVEWHQEKTMKVSPNLTGGQIEFSTPAGIPKCVSVTEVNVLIDVRAAYDKIVTQDGFPTTTGEDARIKNKRIPIVVSMSRKETDYGDVFSGTISVSDLQAAVDYDSIVPNGYFSSYFSATMSAVEVKFHLSVP